MRFTCRTCLVWLVLLASGASSHASTFSEYESVANAPRPGIHLYTVSFTDVVTPILATGTIMSEKTSDIGPTVSGEIEEIYVHVGKQVSEGDALFRTKDVALTLQKRESSASVELYAAELDKALLEFERVTNLRKQGVASQAAYDAAATDLRAARARVAIAESRLAQIEQNIRDSIGRAPFTGVVTARFVDEGVFIANGLSGMGKSAVVRVQKVDPVVAIWSIPFKYLPEISLGSKVEIQIDGIEGVISSEIHVLNHQVDIGSRSIDARSIISNPDYGINPGLFARAKIYGKPQRRLLIPRSLVHGLPNDPYVLILKDGHQSRRHIVIRDYDDERIEVIGKLEEGESIVIKENTSSVDGGPVPANRLSRKR